MPLSRAAARVVLATLALAPAAGADVIIVDKNGPISTIQAGVDAAGPLDTVRVKKGTYQENLVIDGTKTGLRLEAKGTVVLEARPAGGVAAGAGLLVLANDVAVIGLVIRNAKTDGGDEGNGIRVESASRFTALRCRTIGCDRAGIRLSAVTEATLRACISTADAGAIGLFTVENVRILACRALGSDGGIEGEDCVGVEVRGYRTLGLKSDAAIAIEALTNTGIEIRGCRIEGMDSAAIRLRANDYSVIGCRVSDCEEGFSLRGTGGVVRDNRLERIGGTSALELIQAFDTLVVDNLIREAGDSGVELTESADVTIRGNQVLASLPEEEPAFTVSDSPGCVFERNRVTDCGGFGFIVENASAELLDNRVLDVTRDGYFVRTPANGALLDGNVALRCGAEGLDQRGVNSIVRFNSFRKCRLDLTNEGTATFTDNKFVTGGESVPPEID